MNVEALKEALATHQPEPDAVLARLRLIRRNRARLRFAVVTLAMLAPATVLAVAYWPHIDRPSTQPIAHNSGSAGIDVADGCNQEPLSATLQTALRRGASIILAKGQLTGASARDGLLYHEMLLNGVTTLAGPPFETQSTGWIGGSDGPSEIDGINPGPLWAPDGGLFAIAWPSQVAHTSVGPILRLAPVVGDEVIFSAAGCWDTTGLQTRPFNGPLSELPGSRSYTRAAVSGFHAVALSDVELIATA